MVKETLLGLSNAIGKKLRCIDGNKDSHLKLDGSLSGEHLSTKLDIGTVTWMYLRRLA